MWLLNNMIDKSLQFFKDSRFDACVDFSLDTDLWLACSERYESFLSDQNIVSEKLLIPKLIHQIWIGDALPKKFEKYVDSIKSASPKFEYKMWTEQDILALPLVNKEVFLNAKNPAVKSDVARLEILRLFGGLYFDTDFELFSSLPDAFLKNEFVTGLVFSPDGKLRVGNSFIFSAPNGYMINKMIKFSGSAPEAFDAEKIMNFAGPYHLSRVLGKSIRDGDKNYLVLPSNVLYPWPSFALDDGDQRYSYVTPITLGMHHWCVSWVPEWAIRRAKVRAVISKLMMLTSWRRLFYRIKGLSSKS
jgi:mannosyltransferase OCH1-like enzyme